MPRLAGAKYGKDNVRLCKVLREPDGLQTVIEMTVCTLLEGDIDVSYTKADNSPIVATDTQKQTIYILAKQSSFSTPEEFATILGNHFVTTYEQINKAHADVTVHRWSRLTVDGKPHPHTFLQDGHEIRNAKVTATRQDRALSFEVGSSIKNLTVLKSTGSAFYGFHRDEFTRLPETNDRILSTVVECVWHWATFNSLDEVRQASINGVIDKAWEDARRITLDTFASDESPSVQSTMYKMAEQILAADDGIQSVDYKLPNRHYFEIDLSWFNGLKNTGADAEVYAPQTDPNGLIFCTVARGELKKSDR